MVEARMSQRGRIPTTLRDLERTHGKEVTTAKADPGRTYRGELVGYAVEYEGERYAVLDTGQELTAVPTNRRDLEAGHTVQARAQATAEAESRERRSLTWALDDLEHERDRGRGR